MVKRNYDLPDTEPEQGKFEKPSEREHLFQVTDIFTSDDEMGRKLKLDKDTVSVKLEVCSGEEEGRTLLCRMTLDEKNRGFFATRLFLKATGFDYKGAALKVDTDLWIGIQAYATVVHNGDYANIGEFNMDKKIDQPIRSNNPGGITEPEKIEW